MGNRGILHNDENRIVRPWAHKAWVTCLLKFKGIKRSKPFSQGNYSELFFLDEATAFAAGHRPCAYCQRARHLEFKDAWLRANVEPEHRTSTSMPDIDKILHAERAISGGGKETYDAPLSELPQGAIFEHEEVAYLVSSRGCLPWSFSGYGMPKIIDSASVVKVLTPRSILQAFAIGFVPAAHPSASVIVDSERR
ncbi:MULTISPECIES: hypothetical protein [unclassified Massilia]|uniref:hypothetical protein n=1 Tax=unclassified Massilia TaxID=2609279 RepID=UPI0018D20E96|nr:MULTISPECIES: hypothetical protein [unclassified Massilia]